MSDRAPFELIRSDVAIRLSMFGRATIRDFAGFQVGVRRKLQVVPYMARDIAESMQRFTVFRYLDRDATTAEIIAVIEATMTSVSDEDAFLLVKSDVDAKEETRNAIALTVTEALFGAFEVAAKPADRSIDRTVESNGWKMWEAISAGSKPKYKWRHAWAEKPGDDFIGFDEDRPVGRIFQINPSWAKDRWLWIVAAEGQARQNWPPAGWETTSLSAACRVEMVYDQIRSGKRRAVAE